jgi:hypothetical protein
MLSTPTPAAPTFEGSSSAARVGGAWFDRRVLTLLATGCLIGMLAGWTSGGPRGTRFRLLNKPQKTHMPVLVPPGPTPRLIPSDSPNATRALWTRASVSRRTPPGAAHSGVIDYIAVFADSAEASEAGRVDYVLESSDSAEESVDPPSELDESLRRTG